MTLTTAHRDAPSAHDRELIDIDPATLLVDLNVRHDNRLDVDFCASIAEHGVLVPIVAVRTTDGALRVRYGHRRTLAAVQTGQATVPVVVVADEATDDAATVERLVTQWAENEHRTGLTTAERADVIGQLSAFGVSPTQIARRTRATRSEVTAALAVHGSELARATTARYEFLDLTQAAVVAEFDTDTEAVKALVVAAREGQFDHVAQRLRDDRRDAAARAAVADRLREQGVQVIDQPAHGDPAAELHRLADAEGTRPQRRHPPVLPRARGLHRAGARLAHRRRRRPAPDPGRHRHRRPGRRRRSGRRGRGRGRGRGLAPGVDQLGRTPLGVHRPRRPRAHRHLGRPRQQRWRSGAGRAAR